MTSGTHTVIVFASWMEAEPFLRKTRADCLRDQPYGLFRIRNRELLVLICGMGPQNASRAMAFLFQHFSIARVCNCGVVGALNDALRIGDINSVHFVAHGKDRNDLNFVYLPTWPHRAGNQPCRLISVDQGLFESYGRRYWQGFADLVDMEGAAIATACAKALVPCHIHKAVSDHACERTVLQKNLGRVSADMADWLCKHLPELPVREAA